MKRGKWIVVGLILGITAGFLGWMLIQALPPDYEVAGKLSEVISK